MTTISYYSGGKLHRLSAQPVSWLSTRAPRRGTPCTASSHNGSSAHLDKFLHRNENA
jgi:hypothetical protein